VGSRSRLGSVRQGLTMLGSRAVRRWALMLVLTGEADHPAQLAVTGLVRARCCELAARAGLAADPDRAFTAGLLSVLDALMAAPLEELLDQLPLDDRLAAALLHGRGAEGELLGATRALEQGDFGPVHGARDAQLVVARSYREALGWADGVAAALV
jgi:EAL and modified HD-GYP domain-containing signal transduction protein